MVRMLGAGWGDGGAGVVLALGGTGSPRRGAKYARASGHSREICRRVRQLGPTAASALCRHGKSWLGQKPSSVLGVDFYGQSTWEDFFKLNWVPGHLEEAQSGAQRGVVGAADGEGDAARGCRRRPARRRVRSRRPRDRRDTTESHYPDRLGDEYGRLRWFAKGQEADYIGAFRRVVGIFRRYSDDFKYDWCPGWGPQELPADLVYPGDDVVDYIGLDVYDFKLGGRRRSAGTPLFEGPFGLQWQRDFAAQPRQAHELSGMGRRAVR